MPRDLETLKDVLWTQFEKAVERQAKYEDPSSTGSYTPYNIAVSGRNSLADLANAIVNVEREARERDASGPALKMPGK